MASDTQFTLRLSQLQELEKSEDYSTIVDTLDETFDSHVNDIIRKWISNGILSDDETKYIASYSSIHLSFVKHCLFYSNVRVGIETLIERLPVCLFKKTQVNALAEAVDFIRKQKPNSDENANENDEILNYIMRMIDARSLTYRLGIEITTSGRKLNDALCDCRGDSAAKNYLYDVKSSGETNGNISINYRHQFFTGCCTFAVALYSPNKGMLKDDPKIDKYICLLAKYVRVVLDRKDFGQNKSIHYCLRGIFALLTNCIPHEYWLDIMNKGLASEDDEEAQKRNPFNLDFFSSIVNKLLASRALQKETEKSDLNDETLLLDATLVFLVKWSDTQKDLDEDEEDPRANGGSSPLDQPNQLLHCLQSHPQFQRTAEILAPYIDAKYDRLRLMTLSILTLIMNKQDFEKLKGQKPHMDKDLLRLIFDFLNQAAQQRDQTYKGISFDTLLHYLYRFLVQDFIKREALPYVSQIVSYAKGFHMYALKILRRIATYPGSNDDSLSNEDLLQNKDLKQFLDKDANELYAQNTRMYKMITYIRQSLAPPPPKVDEAPVSDNGERQAFISYCHEDRVMCDSIREKLAETGLFTTIWIDKDYMRDNMVETVTKAINHSQVVFILLSDKHCTSDFCRREWNYAIGEGKKIYVIIVQKDFKKEKYHVAKFNFAGDMYYKLDRNDELRKLFESVRDFLKEKGTNESKSALSPQLPKSEPMASTGNRDYLRKTSISTWTSEDIQNWCSDNHLKKWRRPLTHFNGRTLLELRRDLSNDSRLQFINKEDGLDIFEIIRFKSEVDRSMSLATRVDEPSTLSSLAVAEHKLSTKKAVGKQRTSQSSKK